MKRILDDLSEVQRKAVTHRDGPLLVVAGAGSGKTRVITHRVGYLIQMGVEPQHILAITFTNKAANEMKERIARFCREEGLWVSTFHSMCARILRAEADLLGYGGNFSIFDEDEALDCMKAALSELSLDPYTHRPSALATRISEAKSKLIGPEEFVETFPGADPLSAEVYESYQAILRQNNAMDFDDLLFNVVALFDQEPDVLRHYQEQFTYILIDEYQDTNHAQYVIASMMARRHRNICATGDPDQSIYTWRGADIRNILDFEKEYPEAKVIKLEENYRSTGNILLAASELIKHNVMRKEKALWTRAGEGNRVKLVYCTDESGEAETVADEIQAALKDGLKPRDIAVFFRMNAQSRSFEGALRSRAIPYQIVGGVEFFLRKEVKDVLAYMRVCVNPSDDIAFKRILNVPPRGIGSKTVELLTEQAQGRSLFEAVSQMVRDGRLKGKPGAALTRMQHMFDDLEKRLDRPAAEIVKDIIEKTKFREYLEKSGDPRAEERLANVEELVSAAADYDYRNPDGSIIGFLEQVALVSDVDHWDDKKNHVTLMTLHSAKGLEFGLVFLTGFEEGLLPHKRSSDSDEEVEEERRLCYVGMTRAMRRLILTYAKSRTQFGTKMPSIPSRFIKEMPIDQFELIDLSQAASSPRRWDEGPGWVAPEWHELRPGDFVKHGSYGEGVILEVAGYGKTRRARVKFDNGEVRAFVLSEVELQKL